MQLITLTEDVKYVGVCKDYWCQKEDGKFTFTIKEVASIHGMKLHEVNRIVKQYSYVWLSEYCYSCDKPSFYITRGEFNNRSAYKKSICRGCKEIQRKASSEEIRDITEKKKDLLVKLKRAAESNSTDLAALEVKSKIFLVSTVQALSDESFNTLDSLCEHPSYTLSPDPSYDVKVLRYLFDKRLLIISLKTSLDAITLHANKEVSLDFWLSTFELAIEKHDVVAIVGELSDALALEKIKQTPEFIGLCREIQLNECLGYLKFVLKEYQISPPLSGKTQVVFSQCLENFSVAQVYSFIWRASRDVVTCYMKSPISAQQTANLVLNGILRIMEQSLINKREVRPFSRNYGIPQSSLSRIVFNTVLGSDDGGFKKPLHDLVGKVEN